jgi:gamma-glutamylcyclotransferase (GGCT)/AIG2-like uncharacterized protein YtfP
MRVLQAAILDAPVVTPEAPAAVAERKVQSIFAYGTLRMDFRPEGGDAWGVVTDAIKTTWKYGTVRSFQLWQDLRSNHPYTLWSNQQHDTVRGTLITFEDPAVFYDRLQVCDIIEEHNTEPGKKSVYERTIVEVKTEGEGGASEVVPAYIYYMEYDAVRAATSLKFPAGDWLTAIRALRGED